MKKIIKGRKTPLEIDAAGSGAISNLLEGKTCSE